MKNSNAPCDLKKYFLIRFDKEPRKDVNQALITFIETEDTQFIATPSTMLTLFKSSTPYNVIWKALGALRPVTAFFLIDVTDCDFAIHMPDDLTKKISEFLGTRIVNQEEYLPTEDVVELNKRLKQAIAEEQFELAATIRDRILKLQNQH